MEKQLESGLGAGNTDHCGSRKEDGGHNITRTRKNPLQKALTTLILCFLFLIGRLKLQRRLMECGPADINTDCSCRSPNRGWAVKICSLNHDLPVVIHVRRHKVQPLLIPVCSCGDLSSFVPSSLSLKGKAVYMHTMQSRASTEEIRLIPTQRQTSTIKTLASKVARVSCKLGKETVSPTKNYRD